MAINGRIKREGDEFAYGGGGPDSRERQKPVVNARDIFVRDIHLDTLKVNALNFSDLAYRFALFGGSGPVKS